MYIHNNVHDQLNFNFHYLAYVLTNKFNSFIFAAICICQLACTLSFWNATPFGPKILIRDATCLFMYSGYSWGED